MNSKCLKFLFFPWLFCLLMSIGQINAEINDVIDVIVKDDLCLNCMESINNSTEHVEKALLDIRLYLDGECTNLHSNGTSTCQQISRNLTNEMSADFEQNYNISWICGPACNLNSIYSGGGNLFLANYFALGKSLKKIEKAKNGTIEECRKCLDMTVMATGKVVDMLKKCRQIMLNACQNVDQIVYLNCDKAATEVSRQMIAQFESRFRSYSICLPVCKN